MATTQLSDVIVPTKFTDYITQNTMERTALVSSGIMVKNDVITTQLNAGAHSFTVPFWKDLGNEEADIVSDDPDTSSTPLKIQTGKQLVRKSFLHKSWAAMNLASELAGSDALSRIQDRVAEYWNRQLQRRLIGSLNGILADNIANDSGDMIFDISGLAGALADFSPEAVIDAAGTLGDAMDSVVGIGLHSDLYRRALKADLIEFVAPSAGSMRLPTYRGLAVILDDSVPLSGGIYTCPLFGPGAVGYGVADPTVAEGTEVENLPSAGNGGGQQVLHSRINTAVHPAGFAWVEGTIAGNSPTLAEIAGAAHWDRVVERKAVPLAFLRCK
ncbi:phage coat protein [Pseudomonas mohnii]